MKGYSSYNDSGVERIGKIPEFWKVGKFRRFANFKNGINFSANEKGDKGILTIDVLNMYGNSLNVDTSKIYRINKEVDERYLLRDFDFLFVRSSLKKEGVGWTSVFRSLAEPVTYCGFLIRARLINKELAPIFLTYYFRSALGRDAVISESNTVTITNLGQESLGDVFLPIPSSHEQGQIAKYLDHKTHLIDTLIEKKQKQIELLQEQRAAIINQAVTKGLNPNVKMKDSRIEWLGEVPEHWTTTKLRYVSKSVLTGKTPPTNEPVYFTEGTVDWFSPGDFKQNFHLSESSRKISHKAIEDGKALLYESNSVLLVGIGATLGKVGIIEQEGSSNQQINAITFKDDFNPFFGLYYLWTITDVMVSSANSATLPILNQSQTKDILMVLPPKEEQHLIVAHIEEIEGKHFSTSTKIFKQIQLLQEYRTTLISEVVTGKIDVRDEVIP